MSTRNDSRDLVLNYVTQVDRIFTMSDIVQATHVPKTSVFRTVQGLLDAKQIVVVACPGSHITHYRYTPKKHMVPYFNQISTSTLNRVKAAYEANPKQTHTQIAVSLGVARSTVTGALNRLGLTPKKNQWSIDIDVRNKVIDYIRTNATSHKTTRYDIAKALSLNYHHTSHYLKHLVQSNVITYSNGHYTLLTSTVPQDSCPVNGVGFPTNESSSATVPEVIHA